MNEIKIDLNNLSAIEIYGLLLDRKIKSFPAYFWEIDNAIKIIKYLIEELLKWNDDDIKSKLSFATFKQYKLAGMMIALFNNSPYRAINTVYPGRFKEWELNNTPVKFWDKDTAADAVRWLIEEKLKWDDNNIKNRISVKVFRENNFSGMLYWVFKNSVYKAIDNAYPGRFKEWELGKVPQNFWNEENTIEAIKWMIEEKLHWTDEDIKTKLTYKTFEEYNLAGMMRVCFSCSPVEAIKAAYPSKKIYKDVKL